MKLFKVKEDDAESTSSGRSARLKRPFPGDKSDNEPLGSSVQFEVKEKEESVSDVNNPFYMLVKAAKLMNPSQFELSKDIACTTPLPG